MRNSIILTVVLSLVFVFVFLGTDSRPVLAQVCPGPGNYCFGSRVTDYKVGCYSDPNIGGCRINWQQLRHGCDSSTCTAWLMQWECDLSTCTWLPATWFQTNCCALNTPSNSCPPECTVREPSRQSGCPAGKVPATGCGACGLDKDGNPKVCCAQVNCNNNPPPPPPVTLTVPDVTISGTLGTATINVTDINPSGSINSAMTFTVSDPTVATITPTTDTPGYQVTAQGLKIGTTTYTASATDIYGRPVSDQGTITVVNPAGWVQMIGGNVFATGFSPSGNIRSQIPATCTLNPVCKPYLIYGSAEAPGVAAARGTISSGVEGALTPPYKYRVQGSSYNASMYNYDYFLKRAGSVQFTQLVGAITDVSQLTSAPITNGYRWLRYSSSPQLNINGDLNLGSNRVVLFVDGDLNIGGKINVDDGRGFFMAVVRGNINVSPSVKDAGGLGSTPDSLPELEGVYFAGGSFSTGSNSSPNSDNQLHIRGSVSAGSFSLQRSLPDNSAIPAEVFEFGVDQVLLLPDLLSRKQVIWKEVAP